MWNFNCVRSVVGTRVQLPDELVFLRHVNCERRPTLAAFVFAVY